MRDFDSLNFDLDGTLWDTFETCAVACNNIVRSKKTCFPNFPKIYMINKHLFNIDA